MTGVLIEKKSTNATFYDIYSIAINKIKAIKRTVKLATYLNVFLIPFILSLLIREEDKLGTKDMWAICMDAHPILNKDGNKT